MLSIIILCIISKIEQKYFAYIQTLMKLSLNYGLVLKKVHKIIKLI